MRIAVPMAGRVARARAAAKRLTIPRPRCRLRRMVQVSDRVRGVTASGGDGWGLYHRARPLEAAGRRIVDLTIGEPDLRTDPAILDAMAASARGGHTGYAALRGTDALRDAVAARVAARTGVPTTRRNVLITTGGQAALFAALMGAIEPGDGVVFPDPYYTTYPGTIRAAGGRALAVTTRAEEAFQPRRADLEAACDARTATLLVNTPNNPTGAVYGPDTLAGIGGLARDRDLWVIADEVYDTQVWSGRHQSLRALPAMASRTLTIGSLSKSHAMTGSRIGWLLAPDDAIDAIAQLTTHTTFGVPGFVQDAALFALGRGPDFESRIAALFRRRRDACVDRLAAQDMVGVIPSGGAMYLMLDIRATGLSGTDFALRLLETHSIAVMPGESFGRAAAGHLRLALTQEDDVLLTALDTLLSFTMEIAR